MKREREKLIESLFRNYKENKRVLAQNYNLPAPSGISYDRIKVQGDNSRNLPYEKTVEYISKREDIFKKVFIVDEVLRWFELEGHGRERFIKFFLIAGETWIKTEIECCITRDTIARWKREVLEKTEMVAKWIDFF